MIKILFICHGNICRSPMAQFVMAHVVEQAGLAGQFVIDSAATTNDEIGNTPHYGTVHKLEREGIAVLPHRAWKLQARQYAEWDMLVYMDSENEWHLEGILGNDPEHKCVRLMAFAQFAGTGTGALSCAAEGTPSMLPSLAELSAQRARDVADPWFTGDFEATYADISVGCEGLLNWIIATNKDLIVATKKA